MPSIEAKEMGGREQEVQIDSDKGTAAPVRALSRSLQGRHMQMIAIGMLILKFLNGSILISEQAAPLAPAFSSALEERSAQAVLGHWYAVLSSQQFLVNTPTAYRLHDDRYIHWH